MKQSLYPCLVLAAAFAASGAMAQVTPDPAAPKSAVAKKEAAKKSATAPKKAAPPKKGVTAKKAAPPKDATPSKTAVSKNVTIYKNTPPPPLKGKDGKDIPTSPDAYDVSSAVPKKK